MAQHPATPPQRNHAQRCGALDAESCACDHWCTIFGGRREHAGWRADCPRCQASRALSWKVSGGQVRWWAFCSCPDDAIRQVLADRLPDCVPAAGRRNPHTVARSELEKLIGLPGAALVLRVACLAWDLPPLVAAERLGMPERTYRRAVTAAKSGREPQVSISGSAAKNGRDTEPGRRPNLAGNRRSQPPETRTGGGLTTAATLVPPGAGTTVPAATKRACARHDNHWTRGEGHPHCLDCRALRDSAGEGQGLAAVALAEAAAGSNVAELLQARARRKAAAEHART